ncbi:putative MFS transporter [Thelonectria olida]|uniref:MFS transporter n=1 Tax=Thelonectria olida TaxID=1576542 RepID=A0A9P9ATX0_9HYPO|nr:putative MFS transporter [Thelonectria olida]
MDYKGDTQLESGGEKASTIAAAAEHSLSAEHAEYLLQRHGTLDLKPIPSAHHEDPYNWPAWKKNVNLVIVSFHAFMTTFGAASIIPAFGLLAEYFGKSVQEASYLVSFQILMLGIGPLVWNPLSNRYGRRICWLLSTSLSLVCNIGCAESKSYGAMMICRILVGFFISPGGALGSGVVNECFFAHERGQKMGIWVLLISIGPATGPLAMGFVTQHLGWKWIYWILAILNGVQFLAYFFFSPETIWNPPGEQAPRASTSFKDNYLRFGRLNSAPLRLREFCHPIFRLKHASIALPAWCYANVFAFASIMMTVEIPQTFGAKFGFNAQQLGLQFIAIIVGSIPGELIGGVISDKLQSRKRKQLKRDPPAEHRLWGSYFGFAMVVIGLLVFTIQLEHAKDGHWNVTPLVGIVFAGLGNQIITTILVTYAVDSCPSEADDIGVLVNFVRYGWGFIGPFWFPNMFESLGLIASGGLMTGIVVVFSVCPVIWLQMRTKPSKAVA